MICTDMFFSWKWRETKYEVRTENNCLVPTMIYVIAIRSDWIKTFENNSHIYYQRITLTNKLKQCSLTMNIIAYIALNKTLKYNLTVTFSSTFQ